MEEKQIFVQLVCFDKRLDDGYEHIDDIVDFEDPNEADFGTSSKYLVKGDLSLFASVV